MRANYQEIGNLGIILYSFGGKNHINDMNIFTLNHKIIYI